MQCAYCGATLQPDAKVCSQCGAEVVAANPPTTSVPEEPIPEAFPYAESTQTAEPPVATPTPEPVVTPAPVSFADIPVAAATMVSGKNVSILAIASLIMGALSLCSSFFGLCGAVIPVIGIILGFTSLKSSNRRLAVAGIVLNGLGLLLAILFMVLLGVVGFFSSLRGH